MLITIAAIEFCLPVLGDTDQPSSVNIHDINIYNSLIQTNDFLAIVPYTIPYITPPTDSVDKTFIFQFTSSNGTTVLGSISAYPYYNSGYGEGVVSLYFPASTAPPWGIAYNIRVAESPALFTSPVYWDFPVSSTTYSAYTANQTANRTLLQTKILTLATQLTASWGISATPLTQQGGSGSILSSYGENYFRNAIYGLQNMCPDLFLLQYTNLDYTPRSWDYSFTTTLLTFFSGSVIGDAMLGFAGLWGVPTGTATSFIIIFLALGIFAVSVWVSGESRTGDRYVQASFLDIALVLVWGALSGCFSPIINVVLAFVFALVGAWVLLMARA